MIAPTKSMARESRTHPIKHPDVMATPWRISAFALCLFAGFTTGCTSSSNPNRDNAFIKYWPPPKGETGLRLAVKDLIDMKGEVTSAGSEYLSKNRAPATEDAECLRIARERNVRIVGKTNLTEFAVTVSGENSFFGTPRNRDGKQVLIPGGSSSGSAVAVATDRADVAFGTDTGGSIRVPAACCGIYGLKTTFGLVSTKGVFPISEKNLDTVGPMAKDIHNLVAGMDLLKRNFAAEYQQAINDKPLARQIKIGRLYLDGTDPKIDRAIDAVLAEKHFKVVRLNDAFKQKWEQADADGKVIALGDAWVNDDKYIHEKGIAPMTRLVIAKGELDYKIGYKPALARKTAWQRELKRQFRNVDFIVVPTLQNLPPKFPFWGSTILFEWLVFNSQNTVGINFSGNPALAVPIPMPAKGKVIHTTSLQLVGPGLSEAALINAGRLLEQN